MTAYGVLIAGVTLALHRQGDFAPAPDAESDDGLTSGWRHRAAVTVAIVLWLLVWFGGWWIGRMLNPGSVLVTMVGAFFGWCIGLGTATLVLYLDERL